MKKLEGKVAVITGGISGIGLATAQRFVNEGAYVFITGRRQSELDAAVKQIGKNNNNVTGVQGDVSNLADLDRLYATVKEQKGRIDILFANAGVGELVPLGEISEAHRQNIRDQRQRASVHGTKSASAISGRRWRFNHSNCFCRRIQRKPGA
jgi:NAD(P)-dependent dehydrogenase (short-subunit alcohol dehydrogenase family)